MRIAIDHTTRYTYSQPVFIEPHAIRLTPLGHTVQTVRSFSLDILPRPSGSSRCLDAEGNQVVHTWFDGLQEQLVIRMRAEVTTLRPNPFDFLLQLDRAGLPLVLEPAEAALLGPALLRRRPPAPGAADPVADLARQLASDAAPSVEGGVGTNAQVFLGLLNQHLFTHIEKVVRREPGIQPPGQTLAQRSGACRDTAVLFMDACRALGVPVRFVSGYQLGDPEHGDPDERDMHAWAEAYLPGGGWRGFDPTHGLVVADRHVVVAASADPAQASPVIGSFRGTGAQAELEHQVDISLLKE